MSTPLGSMHIKLGLDSGQFASNLNGAKRAVAYFRAESRALDAALKTNGSNLDLVKAKHTNLRETIESQKKVVEALQRQFKEAKEGSAVWEKKAADVQKATAVLEGMKGELKQVEGQLNRFSNVEAFKGLTRDVNQLESKIGLLDTAMSHNVRGFGTAREKSNLLKQAFEKQSQVVRVLKTDLDNLDPQSDEWAEASQQVDRHTQKLIELKTRLTETNSLSRLGTWFGNAGTKLTQLGNAMMPVSLYLQAGFKAATQKAIDFEGQMQVTKSLLSDTVGTAEELNTATGQLGDASKRWAREYGISTSEINVGMQELIKGGLDANQTMGAMPAILEASKATGEGFNVVMGASTSIMSQFGLTSSDTATMLKNTQRVTDSLSFVANKTKAGFADMGLAMEYVGPVAHSVGMELEETSAAIGLLSDAGIDGQKAGTALRGALSKLLGPSAENAAAFEKLGFSSEEFLTGAIKLPDVLDRIRTATQGMTQEQKAALIAQAFGIEAQSGMNILVNEGGDALRRLTEETKKAEGYTSDLAKKMSGGGKSAVERFKSAIEVLQINIGQKLLPALTPLIEKVSGLIDWFSKLSPEVQNFWTTMLLGVAASYPVLNILGNVTTSLGTLSTGLGKLAGKKLAIDTVTNLGTAAAGASGGISGLVGQGSLLAGLLSPTGLLVAGGVLAAGAFAYFATEANKAEQRTREWGTAVSETEAHQLSGFKSKVDEVNQAMLEFEAGAGSVDKVKTAFDNLYVSVEKLANKELAEDMDLVEKLGLSETVAQALAERTNRMVENVRGMNEQVKAIYERHQGDMSQLSQAEKELVLRNQNEMIQAQLELMEFSAEEKKAITAALNGELDQLNLTQLNKALTNTTKMLEDENKAYKDKKSQLKEILEQFGDDTSQLNEKELAAYQETKAALESLEADHVLKTQAYKDQWLNIQRERVDQLRKSGKDQELVQFEIATITRALADEMGISYQKAAELLGQSVDTSTEKLGLLSNASATATAEVAAANTQWDSLFTSSNPQESLNSLLSTAEGWNSFEIMVKNADVNPAGRAALADMLVAGGQWQGMTMDQKLLVVDGQQAMVEIFNSKSLMEQWQALTPAQKQLLAENLTAEPTMTAQQALDSVKQTSPAPIQATDSTAPEVAKANQSVNSPKQVAPVSMLGRDDTGPSVSQVQGSVNSPRQVAPVSMLGRDDTAPQVASANRAVNSPKQATPASINATDNTSGAAQSAKNNVNSVQDRTVTITAWFKKVGDFFGLEKGTNFHRGGPALVNDQKGPLYRELVTLPSGQSFIPKGRNVLLDLPRGSKVLPALATRKLMRDSGVPRYAQGVGYPSDAPLFQEMEQAERVIRVSGQGQSSDGQVVKLLQAILSALSGEQKQILDLTVKLGNKNLVAIAEEITQIQTRQERLRLKSQSF